ncbi:nucleic-acid-binding protein from transposon X-element [Trichonephila clavipes]|nr:nucleic-acid-binding protein from transposon X-element [Trichonephila clavipes]
MRSHTFEMADNKQLKAVIRGLPTDYDQKEIASELKGFGFEPSHISILRNRKTNTNMPLFLVVLKKNEENKQIFQITNIGFFRVVIEPLKGSSMPPQCYRCQEFYHHSNFPFLLFHLRGSLSGEYGRPRPRGTRVNFEKKEKPKKIFV